MIAPPEPFAAASGTDEAGYTLVELVVALLLAGVLASVLFSAHLAMLRWVEPWRRGVALENDAHLITRRLAADLAHAEQFFDDGAGRWRLTYRSGRSVAYRHEDGRLTRNGHPMHSAPVRITSVRFAPSKAETRYALRRRDTTLEDERSLMQITLYIAATSNERTLAVTTTVALRQHRPWQPLR
ncbi:MAG: prepilin-type N-terminal cleavage/methylation domain-containing protein [Rhodothermales bacterium]|nr:prepilin-type N-terminal cleavage/methylation domain-containing protein [Rhodothermales bacterium]